MGPRGFHNLYFLKLDSRERGHLARSESPSLSPGWLEGGLAERK